MRTIPLTQGKVALVDDADYERVTKFKWHFAAGYAKREGANGETVLLHRFILDAPPGLEVDHRSGDGLDNRRSNIRLCTRRENRRNMRRRPGLKGVYFHKGRRAHPWFAQIKLDSGRLHLGVFASATEAAAAYDAAALRYYGEFARTNASMVLFHANADVRTT